ncbi:50S ribosomal protein L12 [Nocardioides anomalus]|uniref:50S ribosomal protein L12 n=1 Tax=Nocardioides anomalus TaxID=2712223 RepID=A0A6G6W8Q8_9ACTN|nr:ribosomal protein L7/L12 [Nocardioides anomalus]QIG41430.1 50S ribosomal protein L12 [Nocardioides anomalus]
MGIFGGSAQDDVDLRALRDRVSRLEATVVSLQAQLAALSVAPTAAAAGAAPAAGSAWLDEVRQLKASGKLIPAIKLYREHTGVGLKEAKDTVEAMV